jgi:hypothetical protein
MHLRVLATARCASLCVGPPIRAAAFTFVRCLALDEHVTCRCAPGFYLAKPYLSTSPTPANGLTGCANGLFTAHDLGGNEGRVKCVIGDVVSNKYDYTFNATCVACGAGKFLDTFGMCMLARSDCQLKASKRKRHRRGHDCSGL